MSPTQNKKTQEQLEREALIASLEKEVKRANERGQFDTVHHTMLERLTNPPKVEKVEKDTKEQ